MLSVCLSVCTYVHMYACMPWQKHSHISFTACHLFPVSVVLQTILTTTCYSLCIIALTVKRV